MESLSPPKRVTRARAAAKSNAPETLKVATAASRARATRGTAVVATTTKRVTRATDNSASREDEDIADHAGDADAMMLESPKPKLTRGRPKKAVAGGEDGGHGHLEGKERQTSRMASTGSGRGRPKKEVAADTAAVEVPRTLRGRPKRTEAIEEATSKTSAAPSKKITRARAATVTKPATMVQKSVQFATTSEPDKENVVPSTLAKGKAKAVESDAGTGFRAKPIRKPAVPTRATRGQARPAETAREKTPLSPKKAGQVTIPRNACSEDELAILEKTPMKPLMKSPVRAPGSAYFVGTAKKLDFSTSLATNDSKAESARDLGTSIMASPARRPPQSPFKDALRMSPTRSVPVLGDSIFNSPVRGSSELSKTMEPPTSPFKTSLLQSPARRPLSPVKTSVVTTSPTRTGASTLNFNATPKPSTFSISRFVTPRTLHKNAFRDGKMMAGSVSRPATDTRKVYDLEKPFEKSSVKPFPGRMSAILPRYADPTMSGGLALLNEEDQDIEIEVLHTVDDAECVLEAKLESESMVVDESIRGPMDHGNSSTSPVHSPPGHSVGHLSPEATEQDPFQDSESEDELESITPKIHRSQSPLYDAVVDESSSTPVNATQNQDQSHQSLSASAHTQSQMATPYTDQKNNTFCFSPLKQLTNRATDTLDQSVNASRTPVTSLPFHSGQNSVESKKNVSPANNTFFEDEMSIRDEMAASADPEVLDALDFAPMELDEQDLALATEADEMSLLEYGNADEQNGFVSTSFEDAPSVSEASQEYADENAVPVDCQVFLPDSVREHLTAEVTPVRPVMAERVFHTICKVPLKPEGVDSPMAHRGMKRSATVARLPTQRSFIPAPIASTPSKEILSSSSAKIDNWSNSSTPARTPRKNLNDQVLAGAVVFVDVHTTEGADASAVFVELLGQMGAKCVKTWAWNPNMEVQAENIPAKIGITHVVFKDGGRRTLEKIRESNGVVLCVGVGWVLDCERNNAWLDEAPYAIDTSLVPRGGRRRRKSMEPRLLINRSGSLSTHATPLRSISASHVMDAPNTVIGAKSSTELNIGLDTPNTLKIPRRQSTQWVRSPASDDSNDDRSVTNETLILSPVLATPAPETISAYAETLLENGAEPTPYTMRKETLIQRTAPPKRRGVEGGVENGNVTSDRSTEGEKGALMQRLLLARRKSLQFAPKVGSPLCRGTSFGL